MQKLGQQRQPLMLGLPGTSVQQKDEELSLSIMLTSYMGSGLKLRGQPTCPKLWQLSRSQRNHQQIFKRLCEAFRVYTPFNLEAPENKQMVNTAFVAQSYADICQKLQKLEGFSGMNVTQLLELANKVFVNWDHEKKKEADKRMKAKVFLLAAALGKPDLTMQSALLWKGRPNGRTPLQ
jgi:hypothetical protein